MYIVECSTSEYMSWKRDNKDYVKTTIFIDKDMNGNLVTAITTLLDGEQIKFILKRHNNGHDA